MSKRHVAYARPEEPAFLKKIKLEAGYREGPTVDTKREILPESPEDLSREEEPTVVVLREGDLNAEQAERERERLRKEKEEAPADLSERIIFKPRVGGASKLKNIDKSEEKKKSKDKKRSKQLLSFDEDEEDN